MKFLVVRRNILPKCTHIYSSNNNLVYRINEYGGHTVRSVHESRNILSKCTILSRVTTLYKTRAKYTCRLMYKINELVETEFVSPDETNSVDAVLYPSVCLQTRLTLCCLPDLEKTKNSAAFAALLTSTEHQGPRAIRAAAEDAAIAAPPDGAPSIEGSSPWLPQRASLAARISAATVRGTLSPPVATSITRPAR